jgi:ribonuclease G
VNEEILVNVTPQETRVAVLVSGQVQELVVERAASRGLVGNIYMGKVARVLPGMQSAFVDIGLERAAFLHVADIWEHKKTNGERAPAKPIEKILAEGQPLMVQVLKDPIGTKGARLSRAGCWSTCRRIRTSASRSASRTKPAVRRCASDSRN